ncbi:MAG: DUF5058 family protein [Bacilli bacterium]|nr:DUF5058 family protein [Bacilli bacterium]MBN2696420.1 DUF5058 family protein [Bacilli bacterium]
MTFAITSVDLVKESWWLYTIGAFVTLFIIGGSLYFALQAYRQAKRLAMTKSAIKKAIISSVSFSVLPSIGIFIGVITMAGLLGIPLPWIRLSVIGALHYELMAVSVAAEGVSATTLTLQSFVTIAFAMTISIIWGGLFALFFFKKYQTKVVDKAADAKSGGFGKLLFDAVFIGMVSAYLGDAFAKMIKYDTKVVVDGAYLLDGAGNYIYEDNKTFVPLIVFFASMGAMALLDILVKKGKAPWLENFQLALSMIFGMTVAVLLGLGGIY